MKSKFKKPRLPERKVAQLANGQKSLTKEKPQLQDIIEKYEKEAKKSSRLIGLSDATGSMTGLWDSTRKHIKEMIRRISEMGDFRMKWVAYRDYCDGQNILEASQWYDKATPLLTFIDSIRCFGGGDHPRQSKERLN